MIKTVWIEAYTKQKGQWEEYEEPSGDIKTGMFGGKKPVMIKKKRWVTIPDTYYEHLVDGERISRDLESALNKLEGDGFQILTISPVISGRYNWQQYDARVQGLGQKTESPDTAVSWGYSVTEGFTIIAKKN